MSRMPSLMAEDSASSIGPPIMKKRSSTPSAFRHLARISEPVSSAICVSSLAVCVLLVRPYSARRPGRGKLCGSDDLVLAQLRDIPLAHAEPGAEHLLGMG